MIIPVSLSVLRAYRRRLTNLSSRNRSLVLSSLPASQFLDLHESDFLLNRSSFSLIEDLIGRKASIPVCAVLDARHERSNQVSRKLRQIDRTARFIVDERGTDDLYVGWPFVRGKLLDGTVIHAPLLFFPVTLSQQRNQWRLTRRSDELGFLNPSFLIAYSQFNNVALPDELGERALSDFDRDPLVFRTQLYEWLRDSPLELNLNSDLFTNTLHFFDKQTLRSLDQLERSGELKLYAEAVLGIFPQAGSYLAPDYDQLIDQVAHSPLSEPAPPAIQASILPEKRLCVPLSTDAPQESALRAIRAGQSLVVQGPPGTGKSQLIANLMADAAAAGRRVLLVCQKRAALDVVQARLRSVGMAPFMALVHDFQDDRKALYAQIAAQIEAVETYRQQNNSLNAVLLERDFELASEQIDESVRALQTFKDALFDSTTFGISPKELYLTSRLDQPHIDMSAVAAQFQFAHANAFTERLRQFAAYQARVGTTHPWADRHSFSGYTVADRPRIDQTVRQWAVLAQTVQAQLEQTVGQSFSRKDVLIWSTYQVQIDNLITRLDAPRSTSVWPIVGQLRTTPYQTDEWLADSQLADLAQTWQLANVNALSTAIVSLRDLPAFRQLLLGAIEARPSWVRWQWWKRIGGAGQLLYSVLASVGSESSASDLHTLLNRVDNAMLVGQICQEVTPWLERVKLPITPDSLRDLVQARQLLTDIDATPPVSQIPAIHQSTAQSVADALRLMMRHAADVSRFEETQQYLSASQLDLIWQNPATAATLSASLQADYELLVEADRLAAGFTPVEQQLINLLAGFPPTDWPALFQNSIRLAWLDQLEQQHPELCGVSSLRMTQTEQSLQDGLRQKQQLNRDMLLVRLREQTYRKLTFNRVSNVTTYRDLLHQTTKKRNVWPLRKLLSSYADDIFKLIPCWLASPESVSAIFPLQPTLFDLVIFDEASQCFAESGLPAFFRGRQIVVTGDSQQLQPTDLYRTQISDVTDDTDEIPPELEIESLLALAARHLPQTWLTEHYRSHSLDLIAFSNQHFYQNRLQLLPYFSSINQKNPAIRYIHVAGRWQQNTNAAEAGMVIQQLEQLSAELPGRSVGVVTFNYPQQQLIQNLLDDTSLSTLIPDLFVKNIENVQGDERDIIIFSVGYAPDERGRLTMQFGSLNMAGGENRLNVAVTRARERVYVITSVWPEQLAVEHTIGEGPKRLRDYLIYARQVSEGQFEPQPRPTTTMAGRALLKDILTRQKDSLRPALPFADLTAFVADTYESLVLTDDDQFYEQPVKQAFAYLPLALQQRGWVFRRVWSREYWRATLAIPS